MDNYFFEMDFLDDENIETLTLLTREKAEYAAANALEIAEETKKKKTLLEETREKFIEMETTINDAVR